MRRLMDEVRQRGGVARVSTIRAAGIGRHAIDGAVARRELLRPRKGWVAIPDADPDLVAAARVGVVLTCVTQAKRLGLWVLEANTPHVAADPHRSRLRLPEAAVHWARPVVPRHPDALEDGIENTLALVAACQPYEAALAVWDSAFKAGLVERAALAALRLGPAARGILADATMFADSGLETFVPVRLRWLGLPIRRQIWIAGHRVDFLIGERLVLQIDGGHHVGAQRAEDVAHDARLRLLGYTVFRVTYSQIVDHWADVQDLVMRAVAQGLHRAA